MYLKFFKKIHPLARIKKIFSLVRSFRLKCIAANAFTQMEEMEICKERSFIHYIKIVGMLKKISHENAVRLLREHKENDYCSFNMIVARALKSFEEKTFFQKLFSFF
jgi:hypothetical protein